MPDLDKAHEASRALRFAVHGEARDAKRTRRRVGAASSLILNMLYAEVMKHFAEHAREVAPITDQCGDTLDSAYLDHWLVFGDQRLRDLRVAHVEFMLSSEEVRRGAQQLADTARMRRYNETEELCDAVRAVQTYIREPSYAHAGKIGQRLYQLCSRVNVTFAVMQGVRLLNLK